MDGGDQGLLRGDWETNKRPEGELLPGVMGNLGEIRGNNEEKEKHHIYSLLEFKIWYKMLYISGHITF